jgi:hypothetical protein
MSEYARYNPDGRSPTTGNLIDPSAGQTVLPYDMLHDLVMREVGIPPP